MFITLESDYAVRIVSALCKSGEKLDAKSISEQTGVTLRFTLKILRKLVSAGLVKSFKGTKGGYIIEDDPKDITLRTVIEAIEGRYYFSRCLSPDCECNAGNEDVCNHRKAFAEVSEFVRDRLDTYNFYDLVCSAEPSPLKEEK